MLDIQIDNLESDDVIALLQEHHQDMLKHSPPESVHALDLSSLKKHDVTFWTARLNGKLAGCCALKRLDEGHAELKSMRTSQTFLRKGVAAQLLNHVIEFAVHCAYKRISLETGTMDAFLPAQKLYKNFGFVECPPFAEYQLDPYSVFFSIEI